MRTMIECFRGQLGRLIAGPALKLLEAVLELLVPLVMADIIDTGIARGDERYVLTRGLMMLGLGVLGFLAALVCQYFAAAAAGAVGREIRNRAFAHVLRLSGGDVQAFEKGGLITRLTGDTEKVQTGINMAIRLAVRVPFLAIGGVVMALRINARAGLIFIAATVLISLLLAQITRKTLPGYADVQAAQDALSGQAGEALSGMRVVRAFSRQETERQAQRESAGELTRRMIAVGRVSALLSPLTGAVANAAIIAIIWLGAGLAFDGRMLSGEIIALVSYMTQTLLALIVAANLLVVLTRALASWRRLSVLLDTRPSVADGDMPPPVAQGPLLRFNGVSFAYHEGAEDALSDIRFDIGHGETVGVIGGTGSGKSTLVRLILREYDVGGGAIIMDGADIRRLPLPSLRGRIGVAPQRAALLSGTVRDNLRMAAPEATDEALWHALELAQVADVVRGLDGGLSAQVQEGGQNLSGGQRQRLSIARALVRRPDLLILDDAASALDYATGAALRHALAGERRARPDMATLVISQRAADIMHADRILVLDDGRIAAMGTHAHLLEENDVYRDICRSQGLITEEGA